MYSIRRNLFFISILGFISGLILAIGFVNPYSGMISVSGIVLQLSGSRGVIPMGINLVELLSFTLRLMPLFVFEAYAGTKLYQYFCTASIYVFSRTTNRAKWYCYEILGITFQSFYFQFISIISTMIVTDLRYSVSLDPPDIILCLYHFLIFSFWTSAMTVVVNLFAILIDSSASFVLSFGMQVTMIVSLMLIDYFKEDKIVAEVLKNINPMSHLVLGWHKAEIQGLNETFCVLSNSLTLPASLFLVMVIYFIIVVLGAVLITHFDLIISNSEEVL